MAVEEPRARVVRPEAEGGVAARDGDGVASGRVNEVSHVGVAGADDVECVLEL